mmetsp:Transcript_25641/g.22657  ORF Transcript_25641/g.22657 Transcript_25641/m.22657 type:complete len:268 (+) Transcript_25641:40-843(+)
MMSFMNRDNSDVYFQQFPNYLSDSQLFPSNLDLQDYSANLLYTDNSRFSGTKKTRKTKELLAHEKNSKDHTVKDIKKQEIIDWIKNMSIEERHKLFCIKNGWLSVAFMKMYEKWKLNKTTYFALQLETDRKISDNMEAIDFKGLEDHFLSRKKNPGTNDKKQDYYMAEEELLENIRIFDEEELYDTILLNESFLNNVDRILEIFNILSEQNCFMQPLKHTYDSNKKSFLTDFSTWFNPNTFQTIGAWIVTCFERVIWKRAYEDKDLG